MIDATTVTQALRHALASEAIDVAALEDALAEFRLRPRIRDARADADALAVEPDGHFHGCGTISFAAAGSRRQESVAVDFDGHAIGNGTILFDRVEVDPALLQ